jgi:hypothetical protein
MNKQVMATVTLKANGVMEKERRIKVMTIYGQLSSSNQSRTRGSACIRD